MDKGNKNRVIFWGIVSLTLIVAFTMGIISYNNGYGKYGKIKKQINPVVENFNSLDEVTNLKDMDIILKASFEKDKINVVYKLEDILLEYNFEYKKDKNRLLIINYDNTKYENINNLIVKLMIEAVSVTNNHDPLEIFKDYKLEDFKNTTIEDGISIKTIDKQNTVILNLDTYILDNIHKEEVIKDYLTLEQLQKILDTEDKTIIYKDKNIILKINRNLNIIVLKDLNNDDYRAYRLLSDIMNILYSDKVEQFKSEYPKIIKENYKSDNFNILYLKTYSDKEFINQKDIIEIIIK